MITAALQALNAPRLVLEAGECIDQFTSAELPPPRDLVEYVQAWVGRLNEQDRYGR